MYLKQAVSRRRFVGGVAGSLGYFGLKTDSELFALGADALPVPAGTAQEMAYDDLAKLANNENPWGPSEPMLEAMNEVWKYAGRYGYPDGGITKAIADHHGVKEENILIGAGSGEILRVVALAFLGAGKKVVGVEPSYNAVYQHASGIRADAITLPLLPDWSQDIDGMIRATKMNYRDVGFFYLVNPNNPTGGIVPKEDVQRVLDEVPEDVPILIDEAYHHFVQDPRYATSVPAVLEGRNVIIARTFSKVYGMAGLRLGYAIASRERIDMMRPFSTGSVSALAKWGGVAALKDTESPPRVAGEITRLRKRTTADLTSLGYEVLPSEANFFMVGIKRPVQPVIEEFRKKGVLVGRPFPPLLEHLRVSIGTEQEMDRFSTAFRQIFTGTAASEATRG